MIPMPAWLPKLVRLTRREYFADFFITPPITAFLAAVSIAHGFGLRWVVIFSAGWFVWTLYEYAVHRASHHAPWLSDLHWLHHRNQKDYIALHPALTIGVYTLIWLLFGFSAAPFAIGFSVGYIVYAALHTSFHYAHIQDGGWLWDLKQRHVLHHRFHDRYFGVTVDWWDRVFRTAHGSGKDADAASVSVSVGITQPVPISLQSRLGRYVLAVLIGVDVLTNAICGGAEYQTISSRIGESIRDGGWASHVPWPAWWRAHCAASIFTTIV